MKLVLRTLARRIDAATTEAGQLGREILAHVRALAPRLLGHPGFPQGRKRGRVVLSPQIQRDTIKRLAKAKGLDLGEIDVSGRRRIEDRELGRLVERVERGESAGIVVWKFSRFSRSLQDCVNVATRIKAAGGRLLADEFDTASARPLSAPLPATATQTSRANTSPELATHSRFIY